MYKLVMLAYTCTSIHLQNTIIFLYFKTGPIQVRVMYKIHNTLYTELQYITWALKRSGIEIELLPKALEASDWDCIRLMVCHWCSQNKCIILVYNPASMK